jgi:hypothetical protein
MVFVADDLGAWLVGLLANAGSRKLTTLLLGSDQERALRQAATAAVQITADELDRAGGEQANHLAMVISEVFSEPLPDTLLARHSTLLEELQAGIAKKLAPLDDANLTGTGQSSAQLLGVQATVLAENLAGHLVREIMLRGSRGGPLAPLADQLNHDVTRLQGQRLEGMLARLADDIRDGLARAGIAPAVASQPVRLLPRPTFLAGREELLADLDARLTGGGEPDPRMVALCGLGGAGKTSVALEYAYRHLAGFGIAWQLAAEEPTGLAAALGSLAAELGSRDLLAIDDPVARVHGMLAACPEDWLLIFDNAPDPAALRGVLPPKGRGQVLITSQNPHWPRGQAVNVPVLGQDVAADFLLARTGSQDREAGRELAVELGGLPLALEQAGAYMSTTGRSIAGYLALFRLRRADLLARGEPTGYDKQVATTWRLAFDQLQQNAPGAIGLLRLLACCAPEQIPLNLLLRQHPGLTDLFPAELAPLLDDPVAADDAVASLRQFSLVSPPQDGLVSVHRLVQAVTIDQLPAGQAEAWRQAVRSLIEAALPSDPQQPGAWPVYAALLPHAQLALPADGDAMARITGFLDYSGNHLAARDVYRQIANARHRTLGAEHPMTLSARANFASSTGETGDWVGARDQLAGLLPIIERVLGTEDPRTLEARTNLARWTGRAGDAAGARDQLAALLPVFEEVLGTEDPATLTVRSSLATWTAEAGDTAKARDQFAALVLIRERVLGAEHSATLTDRAHLANWTGQAGDPVKARDQFTALVLIRERVLGTEHPETLTDRANLAYFTGLAGDAPAARDQFAELLPIHERVFGDEHPETLIARANLARWTGQAGDPAGACEQLGELLPIHERVLGAEHPNTLAGRANLAYFTGLAGDAAAARDQFAELLPVIERVLGPEHPLTMAVRNNFANWTQRADLDGPRN